MESLLVLLVVIIAFAIILGQGRRVSGCLSKIFGGLFRAIVGCAIVIIVMLVVGNFALNGVAKWWTDLWGDNSNQQSTKKIIEPQIFQPPTEPFAPANPGKNGGFGCDWGTTKESGKIVKALHNGVDVLVGRTDKPEVHAIADGVVKYTGGFGTGWGNAVFIEHKLKGSPYVAVYGHIIINNAIMKKNYKITQGNLIGWVDNNMHGLYKKIDIPHLHFGLFRGSYAEFPQRHWGGMPATSFPGKWLNPSDYIK